MLKLSRIECVLIAPIGASILIALVGLALVLNGM